MATMVVKFHMQHYQTAGFESDKIQPGCKSKMATDTSRELTDVEIFVSLFKGNSSWKKGKQLLIFLFASLGYKTNS